jgi:hypothetical protein
VKGRHFYTCQKPQTEQCGFFLWDTDAAARERDRYGETLAPNQGSIVPFTTAAAVPAQETAAAGGDKPPVAAVRVNTPSGIAAPITRNVPPPLTKQTVFPKVYPALAGLDDVDYLDTPTKRPSRVRRNSAAEEIYDWEDSDEERRIARALTDFPPPKRPRFDIDFEPMQELEISPPASPRARNKPIRGLADPFTTPPRQVTSTPHTPPETRLHKSGGSATLLPHSFALLHKLEGHQEALGADLYTALKDHLIRCGRVADGAVKGRESARAALTEKDKRIEKLEMAVRILEAEREVDRAVIGALKRNVDVLTGKEKRTD